MALVGFGSTDSRNCGCSSMRGLGTSPDGLGISPDGLGADKKEDGGPFIQGKVTGNSLFDAVLGAGLGYALSPKPSQDLVYAAAGGAVVGLVGLPGLLGLVAIKVAVKAAASKDGK